MFGLKTNSAIEMLASMARYARRAQYELTSEQKRYQLDTYIESYMGQIEQKLPRIIRNEIDNFFIAYRGIEKLSIRHIHENNISTPVEFVKYFKSLTAEEVIEIASDALKLSAEEVKSISYQGLLIHLGHLPITDDASLDEEAQMYYHFFKYPKLAKERLDILFETYYNDFFQYIENAVMLHLEEVKSHHMDYVNDDLEAYLSALFKSSGKIPDNMSEGLAYISYFYELDAHAINETGNKFIYGFALENRFNEQERKKNTEDLLKALSDPKRIEILRLIGKKRWYSKELAEYFNLAKGTMSYHINKLLSMGIIKETSGEFNRVYYSVDEERLSILFEEALDDLLNKNEI